MSCKTINDFLGNEDVKRDLHSFLSSDQHSLLIIGPSGSGKTSICNLAINEWGKQFQSMRPTYEDFNNHKEFTDNMYKFIYMRNMFEIFENKKKLLFLDDVDTLITQDRFANTYIQTIIGKIKDDNIPVKLLLTCTSGQEKKISDLKKIIFSTRLCNPSANQAISLLTSTYPHLSHYNNATLIKYVTSFQCNIRSCLLNHENIDDENCIQKEYESRIVYDKNIVDIVRSIFETSHLTVKQLSVCLSEDPALISYIMYDNFIKYFPNNNENLDKLLSILKCFTISSSMETVIYNKNDWLLHDISNLFRCGIIKHNCKAIHQGGLDKDISYTTITTRASNFFNMIKRVGEHQSILQVSFASLQRYQEIDADNGVAKSKNSGKKHKEDSGLNNYIKRICIHTSKQKRSKR